MCSVWLLGSYRVQLHRTVRSAQVQVILPLAGVSYLGVAVIKLKATYSARWTRLVKSAGDLPRNVLEELGEIMVEEVVRAARRDAARARGLQMKNQIPNSSEFFKSFGYRIVGKKTVEITSTWASAKDLVTGRDPFEMTWLKSTRGKRLVVPMEGDGGEGIFRTAPLTTEKGWIHPGIAKHTFIEKGMRIAKKRISERIYKFVREGK
jgi:hypothetical protein